MPTRDVHVNLPLSNMAIAYRPEGFIADLIAPVVSVPKQSDAYFVWDRAAAFRVEDDKRAPGTESNVIRRDVSSDTFFCEKYGLKDRLPYEDIANADAGHIFAERSSRAQFVKDKLMLAKEYRVAMKCTSGSNCGSYSATASGWTDVDNAEPYVDIMTAIANVEDYWGVRPNSIVFGGYAWRQFRQNNNVLDRVYGNVDKGLAARVITRDQTKALFEVERLLVGGTYYNSADEGQTASLAQLWNDNVLVYYAPLTPRKDKPSFMYSFHWDKLRGLEMAAKVFDLPKAEAEEVELTYYADEKITASGLSFLMTGVGSSQ